MGHMMNMCNTSMFPVLTFKLVLRQDGDKVKPDWKSFFHSNRDECRRDMNALPSEINKILEMSRRPYGCSKQTVVECLVKLQGSSDSLDVLKEALSDDAEAQDYFPNNYEIFHCFSALTILRYLTLEDAEMSSYRATGILMQGFVAHWHRWIPSGSFLTNQSLPLSFLLHAHRRGANTIYRYTFKPDWACLVDLLPRLSNC
ncbi:hypothetical protein E1B28_013573 [Marasmius oreades]|uniref:Uncharacterized protein n=1 Tax=Marasmius oreades TaxID=181124 RepID=A0A9P7RQU6_9AGAR|nr:uncharacterized protein E1B28_013573 [Marasmius oreades]KAG7087625.1 hypothetical protein E1B28_013573 [Marasmius oreades]